MLAAAAPRSNNILIQPTISSGAAMLDALNGVSVAAVPSNGLFSIATASNVNGGSSASSCGDEPDPDAIKMFVGQIPRGYDENQLKSFFEEYGRVHQLNILRDKATGTSRGCCFVTYYHRKDAIAAQCALHDIKTLPGMHHPVQMKPADSENRNGNERKLFIGMLNKKFSENDVKALFISYGSIEDCTVLRDNNGASKGCAFVTFASRAYALNAIKAMHHSQTMEGCSMPLVVKFADTQKDKEQKKTTVVQQQVSFLGLPASAQTSPMSQSAASAPQYLNLLQQSTGFQNQMNLQQLALLANAAQTGGFGAAALSGLGALTAGVNPANLTPSAGASQLNLNSLATLANVLSAASSNGATNNPGFGAFNLQNLAALAAANSSNPFVSAGIPGFSVTTPSGSFLTSKPGGSLSTASTPTSFGGNLIQLTGSNNPSASSNMSMSPSFGLLPNTPGSGLDALSQAYSKMQQYTASFPSLSTNLQIQQAVGKQQEGPDGSNLFIYHLPQEFTDSDLAQTFLPFGTVLSAKVFVDKQTNLSKCFGFVSYDNAVSAHAAITAMNGFQIGTKRLKVQHKRSKQDAKPYQHPQHGTSSVIG